MAIIATYPGGEYPIDIGVNLLDDAALIECHLNSNQALIVTNKTVAHLYLKPLQQTLKPFKCDSLVLPDGEKFKTFRTWKRILDTLAKNNHHRDTTLIALGGGVVGDITGFAAACYQRGVNFIQIPTTLLAQVDSSIGGKTAINHPCGKNLIGAFHQPIAVIIDINTLNSLPEREYRAGLAEMIKAALIRDSEFFNWLELNLPAILERNPATLTEAIERAVIIKRDIVAEDEKEQGVRALLNLGHTFGHAIEQQLGYGKWLHGEAVGMGIIMAANLSHELNWINEEVLTRIVSILTQADLPNRLPPSLKCDKLLAAMHGDKKVRDGKLNLVLLKGIGNSIVTNEVSEANLKTLLSRYTKPKRG